MGQVEIPSNDGSGCCWYPGMFEEGGSIQYFERVTYLFVVVVVDFVIVVSSIPSSSNLLNFVCGGGSHHFIGII